MAPTKRPTHNDGDDCASPKRVKLERVRQENTAASTTTSAEDDDASGDSDSDVSEEDSDESGDEGVEDDSPSHFDQAVDLKLGYNKLQNQIKGQNAEIAREGGVKIVTDNIDKANNLFSKLRRNQGSAIMATDSATLKQISSQALLASRNLKLGSSEKGLDSKDFTSKVTAYLRSGDGVEEEEYDEDVQRNDHVFKNRFNWLRLGNLYAKTSRQAPTTEFLQGTIQIEQKTRTVRARQMDDVSGETVRATALSAADVKPNEDKETSKNVERSYMVLKTKAQGAKINLFKFMIDPNSFARSVENLFYTSFLISHGLLTLFKDNDGVPTLQETSPGALEQIRKEQRGDVKKYQIIFRMDYSDWQGLIRKYHITESFL